jgi:hypothetical protein
MEGDKPSRVRFLNNKRTKKYNAEIQSRNNHNSFDWSLRNEHIVDYEVTTTNLARGESFENEIPVGAFAVGGNFGDMEQRSLPDEGLATTESTKNFAAISITSARLVNDDIVNAVPIKGLRCRLISIFSLLLSVGITLVVILTRGASRDSNLIMSKDAFVESLKPLLTKTSRQELEMPGSVPALALDWLLVTSNFEAYSFDHQVQGFAMAACYCSTEGGSWNQNKGWLVEHDECNWYQSTYNNTCVNGILQVLSLPSNNLNGSIPKKIFLF